MLEGFQAWPDIFCLHGKPSVGVFVVCMCSYNQKHIYAVFNVQNDGCKCPDGFKGDGVHKCEGKNRFVNPVQLLDVLAILQSL